MNLTKIYLAIPYTGMEDESYELVNKACVEILRNKEFNVFSPITHSHPLAKNHGLEGDWNFWQNMDKQFIDWCDELWVVIPPTEDGMSLVRNSVGVQAECEYAASLMKPIHYFSFEEAVYKIT
jgi:hypothetical protein